MKPKALVVVLCGSERNAWIVPGLSQRLLETQHATNADVGVTYAYDIAPVTAARNWCCAKALEANVDFLVMVDCDQVPPANFVERVIGEINERPEISIAVLPSWMYGGLGPCLNVVPLIANPTKGQVATYLSPERIQAGWREIGAGGAGVIFIRARVLKVMDHPWFRFGPEAWDKMERGAMTGPNEDFDFVTRARDQYYCRTFTNAEYICDHLHTHSLASLYRHTQFALQAIRERKCIVVERQKDMGVGPEVKIVGFAEAGVPFEVRT